ncbi:MAG: WS/DGAT domain-containing protein [Myxococcales bacterium]|nr:WS/DGAT domain-containing protein [Myxococcales bacterium]
MRAALGDVTTRFPTLRCKIRATDFDGRERRFEWLEDPAFTVDAIFRVVDSDDLAALARQEQNRPLDPLVDFPVTLTLARARGGCRLFFRQHHASADGRAFIGLLVEFAALLEAHRAGRPVAALMPVHRRDELAPLALSPSRHLWWRLAGYLNLARRVFAAIFRPVAPLLQNVSNDYSGENGTVHWSVDDSVLPAWNDARKRVGASLNSMLTAAFFAANQRWHRARGAAIGRTTGTIAMETRPHDGVFVSFANHLTSLDVTLPLGHVDDPAAMARAVQAQVDRQRRTQLPFKRLVAERAIVANMPLSQMRRMIFDGKRISYNLGFSNLIALDFPTLGGDGWRVEEVLITTPISPRHGLGLTCIRYNGRLLFNFNYKASAATRADAEELCAQFQRVVAELTS